MVPDDSALKPTVRPNRMRHQPLPFMKQSFRLPPVSWSVLLCGAAALTARAQFDRDDPTFLKNRVSVSTRFMFNYSVDLRNTGLPANAGPNFDDGYVRTDASGNAGGKTWYWGFDHNNQVVGDTVNLHSVSVSPQDGTSASGTDAFAPGFELRYGRELKRWLVGEDKYIMFGVEGGFGSTDTAVSFDGTQAGTASRTTSSFSLNGAVPPVAPYAGTFAGPGPLLNATPGATSSEDVAVIAALNSRLRSLIYGFRFGPFVEVPLSRKFDIQLGAGVAAMYSDATLSYNETLTLTDPSLQGGGPPARVGEYTHGDWMLGYYAQAVLAYHLNDSLRVFGGGEFENLGENTVSGPGREATLKVKNSFGVVLGIQLLF